MLIKNIEDKIRLATFVSVASLFTAILIVAIHSYFAYRQVGDARKVIYILNNNMALQATQTDMQMNRPAEYRAVIDQFHSLFFSLTPDDKFIEYQLRKAMYLVDESGVEQYNNLKENGYFNSILSSSSVRTLSR
jgi:conjugative transposon TraK protein